MFIYTQTYPTKITWRGRLKKIRNWFRSIRGRL